MKSCHSKKSQTILELPDEPCGLKNLRNSEAAISRWHQSTPTNRRTVSFLYLFLTQWQKWSSLALRQLIYCKLGRNIQRDQYNRSCILLLLSLTTSLLLFHLGKSAWTMVTKRGPRWKTMLSMQEWDQPSSKWQQHMKCITLFQTMRCLS